MNRLIEFVNYGLHQSLQETSKLPDSVLNIEGKTSKKFRILLNTLASNLDTYLEIGTFKGGTFISTCYNNKNLTAYGMDNFSQFNPNKTVEQILRSNINSYKDTCKRMVFFNSNCWEFDIKTIEKSIDMFFYDGPHTEQDQYKSLLTYLPIMQNQFLYIVDDFNWTRVEVGTVRAIEQLKLNILYNIRITHPRDGNIRETELWWNGIAVYVLEK